MIGKIIKAAGILLVIYLLIVGLMYFFQENLIFHPEELNRDYAFDFEVPHEELFIEAADGALLNGLLFKADSSKGLIFYLHGNRGSLRRWGRIADTYTELGYDLFMLDYRGYGKSEGAISSEGQVYSDLQAAYKKLEERYPEIVILGYSIGSGLAAKLAADNEAELLILQAPYYSLVDMMENLYPLIPTTVLKYRFETAQHLRKVEEPVVIFHGDADNVIYYGASLKLKEHLKPGDTLITLPDQGHNGFTDNPQYLSALKVIL